MKRREGTASINEIDCFQDNGVQDARVTLAQLMLNAAADVEDYEEGKPTQVNIPNDDDLMDQAVNQWNLLKATSYGDEVAIENAEAMNTLAQAINAFIDFVDNKDWERLIWFSCVQR